MTNVMQHPVPERLLVHIGDITVSFALLESNVQILIGSLIGEHQRLGQIITAELSFRGLRALAVGLYRERHGEDSDFAVLRDLVHRAAELENTRNRITHSLWLADTPETITRFKMTAKESDGIRFQFETLGEADLAKVALELKVLAADVQSYYIKLLESGKARYYATKTWGTPDEAV